MAVTQSLSGWRDAKIFKQGAVLSCALLLVGGGLTPAHAETAIRSDNACTGAFPAPATPMFLSRQIRRELRDGKEIVVTRRYRVSFDATANGFVIHGDLLGTDVDVPEPLAGLAAIERQRPDTTTFPMKLDVTGLIIAEQTAAPSALPPSARSLAGRLIAGAGLMALEQGQAEEFVDRLFSMQGPVVSQWPEALFRPSGGAQVARDTLRLPGGREGKVTISLTPQSSRPCALMQRMDRTIETRVDGVSRRTQEIWTLTPGI